MSATIFCCSSISPYRPRRLDHEAKFTAFIRWAHLQKPSAVLNDSSASVVDNAPYAVQLVRQVNYGPQESIRYFVPKSDSSDFLEATEDDLVKSNFEKLNSYKNFRCDIHNRFFEVNLYQRSPTNAHHWRSNLARPSRDIDLVHRQQTAQAETSEASATEQEKAVDSKASATFGISLGSLLPALEEAHGTAPKELERCNRPDNTTLKRILRFLLPVVGQNLGSNSLISLLCLDRTNAELDLDLNFEILWEIELTSSNILVFFADCIGLSGISNIPVNVAEIEALVIPAIRYVDSRREQFPTGRAKLHEIVKKSLESGRFMDWVPVYRDDILRVFTSGPGEALLKHCQSRDAIRQQNRSNANSEGFSEAESGKADQSQDDKELWWPSDDDDNVRYGYYDESDHEATKDFTACDKECGYCGNCDY